jgi:RNA polymerase primary sigma factor
LVDPNAEDIKLGPDEPELDPDAEVGDEDGDDEGGGGGGAATANAKQLEELKANLVREICNCSYAI